MTPAGVHVGMGYVSAAGLLLVLHVLRPSLLPTTAAQALGSTCLRACRTHAHTLGWGSATLCAPALSCQPARLPDNVKANGVRVSRLMHGSFAVPSN